ncbi:MAG: S9 family peptidase [Alphaproteobacteria bacterium]|nr:S9 family peptidase [Alphaproteobacteria bacterium]
MPRLKTLLPLTLLAAAIPPEVVLDGAPEPDPEVVARLRPYLEPRGASLADLAPDGRAMLILTRFGDTTQVHRVDAPLGARTQLTFGAEPVGSASWTPDGALLYLADVGGNEQHQLLALREGRGVLLTDGAHRHTPPLFSADGRRVAFSNNARNQRDTDVRLVTDGAWDTPALVTEREGAWHAVDFSPDGRRLIVGRYVSVTQSLFEIVDLDTGDRRPLTPEGADEAYGSARFQDADTIWLTSDRAGDFHDLWRVDLGRKPRQDTWTRLTEDLPWDVREVEVQGDTVAFVINEEGWSRLYLLDTATGERRSPALPPMSIIHGIRFAAGAPVLGLTLSGPDRPPDAYTLDLADGTLTRWTRSEIGGLDPDAFIVPELIRYESFDGLSVPAFVYRPPGPGPHPALIRIHGGPESQARPLFQGTIQYLLTRGIAVVIPNVRGSRGYGRDYLLMDNGRLREDSVRDIGALLDWIAADPGLDEARVGVAGGSYGGYMVLASLIHFGDRIRAGCDMVGISSFVTFLENTRPYRQDLRRVEYGDERDPEMRAFLQAISPLSRAHEIRSALFVAHGANDPRVPVGEAEQIVEAVRASGHDAWYLLARDEGHGFQKKPNRDLFAALQIMFFEEHLLGN